MNKKIHLYALSYYIWIVLFVIFPIILVFINSFVDINGNFSFVNYDTYFSKVYLEMTFNSIWYAFFITLFCLLFAYPCAYIISRLKHQKLLLMLLVLPSWVNLLLKTYAFMGLLSSGGFIVKFSELIFNTNVEYLFNVKGFMIVSIYIFIPFMILPIYNSIKGINKNLIIAAKDLGASEFVVFKKIILPLTKSGIYSGMQLVFIPSLSIFMITRLIAGNRIITLGTAIEEHFLVTGNWGMGSAIGSILIIFLFISIIVMQYPKKKFLKKANIDKQIISGGTNA